VDVLTGLHATVGILAALHEREVSGRGQHVSVNLLSSTLSALVNQAQAVVGAGAVPRAMGNAHPSIAPYETLPTADGVLALAVGNDRQFRSLCEVLGLDLAVDPDYASNPARVAHRETLAALLGVVLTTRPTAAWVSALTAAGVPAGPVNDIPAALELATTLGLAPVVMAAGVPTVASPITLSRTPVDYRSAPPRPHPGPDHG
jgi:crotonobetainyl-CoA:carnitine CoA-transferase CaiB-like acyl-CoA transferase